MNGAVSSDDEGKGSEPKEGEQSDSDEEREVIFLGNNEQAKHIQRYSGMGLSTTGSGPPLLHTYESFMH